jgi:hypothetical protein
VQNDVIIDELDLFDSSFGDSAGCAGEQAAADHGDRKTGEAERGHSGD